MGSADHPSLHPLLRMLLQSFPDALEYHDDRSLTVVDRDLFADPSNLGLPAQAPEQYTCGTCHDAPVDLRGQQCQRCQWLEREAAVKARSPQALEPAHPDRPIPSTLRSRATPVPTPLALVQQVPPASPVEAPVEPEPARPQRPPRPQLVIIGGPKEGEIPPVLPGTASELRDMFAKGVPSIVPVELHPNVLDLYGVDLEFAVSVIREPKDVTIDATDKRRSFPVLRFHLGDLYVVMGFKDLTKPAILGVYVNPALEHDHHEVHVMGGGGGSKQKTLGRPRTVEAVVKRIRMLGCTIGQPNDSGMADVTYHGQELGKMRVMGIAPKTECESTWDRMQRKVHAIERRASAAG